MNSSSLEPGDQEAIAQIYEELKKVTTPMIKVDHMNQLFRQALLIAEKYGEDHPLFQSLLQTKTEYLDPLQYLSPRTPLIQDALASFVLFFKGDLLGWFVLPHNKQNY